MAGRLQIFMRYNSSNNIPVQIEPTWNIRRLKEEITRDQDVNPSDIRIIFAGRELRDDLSLSDCDIPNQSVIHAVQARGGTISVEAQIARPLSRVSLHADDNNGATASSGRATRYYVYCRSCKSISTGKLRVCCATCKDGAFVYNQDPDGWEDVLVPRRISGVCQAQGCNGTVAEFFFKCAAEPGTKDRSVPLQLVKSNTQDVPCLACTEEKDPVLVFTCHGRHAICLDCFEVYCATKLNDRQFVQDRSHGYTLPCPGSEESCQNAMITEAHHFRILGNDQYNRYQRFATEEYVLQTGGVLCPGRGCGSGILFPPGTRRIHCDMCNLDFCRECKEPFRARHSCRSNTTEPTPAAQRASRYQVNSANADRARWDREARNLIDRTSKRCPGCRSPTEKNGGCNHMTCSRCKFNWCWICVIEWNPECQGNHWFH